MDELNAAEEDILERIADKPELCLSFFKKAKNLKWFFPLQNRGYFNPEKNPAMQVSASGMNPVAFYWPAADYIAEASKNIKNGNDDYAQPLLDVIRSVTKYSIERGETNYRTWWSFSKAICNIPTDLISVSDMELVDYWLDDPVESSLVADELGAQWLEQLLQEQTSHSKLLAVTLAATIFKVVYSDVEGREKNRKHARLRISSWAGNNILKKIASAAGGAIGVEFAMVFELGIRDILETGEADQWSYIRRPSIGEHEQNMDSDDAEDLLIDGLRDSLQAVFPNHSETGRHFVKMLLESNLQVLNRIALYTIDNSYIYLESLSENILFRDFFSGNFQHEFWHLLKNRFNKFPEIVKSAVIERIISITFLDENGVEQKSASAYRRAIWLASLRSHSGHYEEMYQENVKIAGAEPEHPDFASYMTGGIVVHKSEYSVDELRSLSASGLKDVLSSYYDGYVETGNYDLPDLDGLAKCVRQLVKASPVEFQLSLIEMSDLAPVYIHEILEAYSELWNEKVQLPWDDIWGRILAFCDAVVSNPQLWSAVPADKGRVGNSRWVVSSIGRLLESSVKSDDHALNVKYHPQVESVLAAILGKQCGDEFDFNRDAIFIAINSPRGQVIEALINLTLRTCRMASATEFYEKDAAWKHFQHYFDSELNMLEANEFSALLPRYLPNFLYMSREWVLKNFDSVFPVTNELRWLCSMQGYAGVSRVDPEIYNCLNVKGHFLRALDDPRLTDRVSEKIIQNIAVAYFADFDGIDGKNGLMPIILSRKKYDELSHMIWFYWTFQASQTEVIREKVFLLWSLILNDLDLETKNGRLLASRLCLWLDFVLIVTDDNIRLILEVAPYADENHNSYGFIKNIARIAAKQPDEAYRIWLRLLDRSTASYPEDAINEALALLVSSGDEGRRNAHRIASAYIKKGNEGPGQFLQLISAGA